VRNSESPGFANDVPCPVYFQALVTEAQFDDALLVIADFWPEWCGPCHMIAPHLEEIAREFAGEVKVVRLDIDKNPSATAAYGVLSLPTLIIFKNGRPIERLVGAVSKNSIVAKLKPYLRQTQIS